MPYAFIPENAIAALPSLSGVAVKTMNAIASFMPGRGAGCYPSLAAIGERAGIKREKTLSAAIKELTAAGVMVCERRRRQTNLLRWSNLEPAETAGTRILERAVSAPLNPFEPAKSAPLDSVLEPAVSALVEPAVSALVIPAVSAPLKVTRKETRKVSTAHTHGDEKQPSPEAEAFPVIDTENPATEPLPPSAPSQAKPISKATPKKQYPGDLDADAEKLVGLYAELVKPKRDDASGSRKVFLGTAKRLLAEGEPSSDMERAIHNYVASRTRVEQQDKDPEAARKYRWGFQTFFGPKNEHWRDYAMEMPEEPADEYVDDYNDPKLVAMITEGIERERQGLEVI